MQLQELRNYLKEIVTAPVYKTEITAVGDPPRWPCNTLYPKKLALTSPTDGGRSVGIVRSRTKAMELLLLLDFITIMSLGWGKICVHRKIPLTNRNILA
jgi:hypothetical protein